MINNTKNNAISEAATKKKLNELNGIKKVETKGKRLIKSQEKLLRLFYRLKTIFNNNNNNNNNSNNKTECNNKNESKNENENVNENENESGNESENKNENESDDSTRDSLLRF